MARIEPIDESSARGATREDLEEVVAAHGRATNIKRMLARSPVALRSLLTWYDLRGEVAAFLGDRATLLFVHAISTGTDCLICSTFFRRLLIDAGDNPDDPRLDDRETLVVEFGGQLARDPHGVSDELRTLGRQLAAGPLGLARRWAEAFVFLASERARYITGSQFVLDAGVPTR